MRFFRSAHVAVITLAALSLAPAYADITVKDGNGFSQQIGTTACLTGQCYKMAPVDTTGVPVDPATKDLQTAGNTTLSQIATQTAGLATAAGQAATNAALQTLINQGQSGGSTGAATQTGQDTGNASLAKVVTNTTGLATLNAQQTTNTTLGNILTNTAATNTALNTVITQTSGLATASGQAATNAALATLISQGQAGGGGGGTTGGATQTGQDTGNAALAKIVTNTTGAATAAGQKTGNDALGVLVTQTSDVATGTRQSTMITSLSQIATNTTGVATDNSVQQVRLALGTPAQAGGKIDTVISGSATDIGAAITTVSVSQTLTGAMPSRRGYAFQNQTTGMCYVNVGSPATADFHSLAVAATSYYESKESYVGTGAISVLCLQAGAVFGRQW
jgi:hypothetical protein